MTVALWKSENLSDLADMCLGKMLDQNKNKGTYLPYLANTNVRWGEIELSNLRKMKFEPKEFERYGLEPGDIVMCEGGEPGRCAIWKGQTASMMIQKALHRIRAKKNVSSVFLYYGLLNKGIQGHYDAYFTGAAIKHLTGENLAKIKVLIPPLSIQQKIARILSAYDDLIENNLKRIKLLEEIAQITYEEWFVRLKFPDHEITPTNSETGLPMGWVLIKVGNLLAKIETTTKIKSTEYCGEGKYPIIDQSREYIAGYTNDEDSTINIGRPIIVFGDHTRILKFVNFPFARGADGTQILLSKDERMPQHLFYFSLLAVDLSNYHYARHFKFLKDCEIILPDLNTAQVFENVAAKSFVLIKNLRNQNQLLKEARGILLPRLMTGVIDVEQLVLPEPSVFEPSHV